MRGRTANLATYIVSITSATLLSEWFMPLVVTRLAHFFAVLTLTFSSLASGSPDPFDWWSDWVSERHNDLYCPWQMSEPAARVCIWPGSLDMELRDKGLRFTYSVEVFRDSAMVALPGSVKHWPMAVTTGGKKARVIDKSNSPYVKLESGVHELTGEFRWNSRPGSIAVPASIALVSISESGQKTTPDRRNGQVVLSQNKAPAKAEKRNSISVDVFRKLIDGVPMILDTQLVLSVSGSPREIRLGQLAWDGTEVANFNSPLPAKIEDNGDIRIQVIPGKHTVSIRSLIKDSPDLLVSPYKTTKNWPEFEYVSFQGDSNVRQAKITGAPSVDTSQTPIPNDWRDLPTYRLDSDAVLGIVTEYRGDHSPAENQLTVKRNLWLDFEGGALTGLESVTGSMHRDWRVNASPDTSIGRAKVSGRPVLVTEHNGTQGVEIRSPSINLSAVTRVASPTLFSATGWNEKADSFSAVLHTPPGWRVLHASGVDGVSGTWVSLWDLWDIFLLLIVAAATKKLLGIKVAVLSVVTMIVCYHEQGMPVGGYPVLLLLLGLLSVASGRIKSIGASVSLVACGILVLGLVDYSVSTFRLAIYPSLERSAVGKYDQSRNQKRPGSPEAVYLEEMQSDSMEGAVLNSVSKMASPMAATQVSGAMEPKAKPKYDAYNLGENDKVQTGPGAPAWTWKSITLRSSSPVPADTEISVSYSSPFLTSLWRILSVFLAAVYAGILMAAIFARVKKSPAADDAQSPEPPTQSAIAPVLAIVFTVLIGAPMDGVAGEYPPKYLLDELDSRLVEAPECMPHCASLDNGVIEITKTELSVSFDAYSAADVVLLLPTSREGWQVSEIVVDGAREVTSRRQQDHLAMLLTEGHHKVSVKGSIKGDSASVSIPVPIHNITSAGDDWLVSGVVDGRVPSRTISLRARDRVQQEKTDTLTPAPVTPFFIVHREFHLGTQWQMTTTVNRLAPQSGPVSLEVPLLSFERPLSGAIDFKDGNANLQFSGRQARISWESALSPMDALQLTAASSEFYLETWRLYPSALWHAEYTGIPAVKESSGASSLQPHWRPWPGEQLDIAFSRPEGVEGPTHTVEAAELVYQAGSAIQQSTLTLQILASLGQDYVIKLPEGAKVISVQRNGLGLNIPDGNKVKVALQPGKQQIVVGFEQTGLDGWVSTTPQVTLPGGASNITIDYRLAGDRWPLYLSGPAIGPAMLFWGVFCVIVIGAFILAALSSRLGMVMPIGLTGWLLLGIGLSTINSYGVLIVAILFFMLAYRGVMDTSALTRFRFNVWQSIIAAWIVISVVCLVSAIPMGLLSTPNMIVTGNGSGSHFYSFFQDRSVATLFPEATVISVPMFAYRVAMLVWSLWLANRLMAWASWGWKSYSQQETWRPGIPKVKKSKGQDSGKG
jgi:hypothetical protein